MLRAATVRASIEHPNLVRARLTRDPDGRQVRLVLERGHGPRLDRLLASGPLDKRDCLRIVLGVARGTDALHRNGLVAGRITPDRIVVDTELGGILADPGFPAEFAGMQANGNGEPQAYLSPEERRRGVIDARSNVYSLGALLRTLITGDLSRRGRNGGGGPLVTVVARAMSRDPAKRFPAPRDFAVALVRVVAAESERASAQSAPEARSSNGSAGNGRARSRARATEARPSASKARAEAKRTRPRPARPRGDAPGTARGDAPAKPAPSRPSAAESTSQLSRRILDGMRPVHGAAVGAALLVTAGALAAGQALTGGAGHGSEEATAIASSAVRVELPQAWTRTHITRVDGLGLTGAVSARSSAGRADFAVGLASDRPEVARLIRAAEAQGAVRRIVRLGALQAWQWRSPRGAATTPTTLFVSYTAAGPLAAVCHEPLAGNTGRSACTAPLRTLTLNGSKPVPLASVIRARGELGLALAALQRDWMTTRARLAAAQFAFAQAADAQALEATFRGASARVASIETPRGTTDLTPVVAALDGTAAGYAKLAAAIVNADSLGYDAARREIVAREATLKRVADQAAIP